MVFDSKNIEKKKVTRKSFYKFNVFISKIVYNLLEETYKQFRQTRWQLQQQLTMRNNSTSPFRSGIYGGEETMHYARGLQRQISILNEQNAVLKGKVKKVNELEEKIELVLKHNTNLLNENQQLSKLINQRKAENQLLKNKYDAFTHQSSASNDIQMKRLKNQIDRLKSQIIQLEQIKNIQLTEVKAQMNQQIQIVKRNNLNTLEVLQLQIRKQKDTNDSKEYEISELTLKYNRLVKDTQFQILKLREEKDRFKKQIEIQQEEHRRDVNNLKAKFEGSMNLQLDNLKKLHFNQADTLAFQNSKLKDLLAAKGIQIEQILSKNLKTKQSYQQEILLLKRENEGLKDKIVQGQRLSQLQVANLREKLEGMRESEIAILKSTYINQTDILAHQAKTLEDIVSTKNVEIEGLIKEKNDNRIMWQSDIKRLRAQLQTTIIEGKQAQQLYETNISRLQREIKRRDEENKTMAASFTVQVQTLKQQLNKYKNLLEQKIKDLQKQSENSIVYQKNATKRIRQLQSELQQSYNQHQKSKNNSQSQANNTRVLNQSKLKQLNEQIKSLEDQGRQKDQIISTLKKTIQTKEMEIDTSDKNTQSLQRMVDKLKKQLQQTKQRSANKESQHNRITKEQRERMNSTHQFEISNLKNEFNNQILRLNLQITDLKKELKLKNTKLDELKRMYDNLIKETERVLKAEANRKQLDIKEPGWLPDTIATKGLFDVFLKNKVIQWCDI